MNAAQQKIAYDFAEFTIDPIERTLRRGDTVISLASKAFDVLCILVQNSGRLVEREALLSAVWADSTVEENSLSRAVADIRKALGEGARQNRFITTVSKRGYRFVAEVAGFSSNSAANEGTGREQIATLAVLPFAWLTQQGSDGPLSIGLADALITRLSNLPQIVVRPTSAILKYSVGSHDPIATAADLGVDFVISGSLQQAGDRVRVTVQMVSPNQQRSVWANQFEETLTHVFTVEDSISERVASALALKLTRAQQDSLARPSTENQEAYEVYLRGRYFWSTQTFAGAQKAIACFRQSIELDPHYALAWAGIADAYILIGLSGALTGGLPPDDFVHEAKHAALRAIELNGELPEAHTSLGFIKFFYEWQPVEAHQEFQRASTLQPNYSNAHHGRALAYGFCGQHDEALTEINRALELEPMSLIYNANKGYLLYVARRYEEALEQLQKSVEIGPAFAPAHYRLGLNLTMQGRHEEAIRHFQEAHRLSDPSPHALGALGHVHALTCAEREAREILQALIDRSARSYVAPVLMAEISAGLGQNSDAVAWLDAAVRQRIGAVFTFNVDPRFDRLRSDAGFQRVLAQFLHGK